MQQMIFTADDFYHLCNTLEILMMGIVVPETCWSSNKICNENHLLHLVGIYFHILKYSTYFIQERPDHIYKANVSNEQLLKMTWP